VDTAITLAAAACEDCGVRHLYECAIRWADMDVLGHVNNVTYVDYLQEARIDMMAVHADMRGGEELAEGVVVVRHEIEFVAPLVFRRKPVLVETWVEQIRAASFTMAYEIYSETDAGRIVHLRARSVLAPYRFADEMPRRISPPEREFLERYLEEAPPHRKLELVKGEPRHEYALKVRWSDIDAYQHVNNVQYLEFFQEARISYVMTLHNRSDGRWSHHAVGRVDVSYRRPMLFRLEPYAVRSWVSHVGTKSFTISSEVLDGDEVLAHSDVVMVAFDAETQRATDMNVHQRERLLAELPD
jgi:acyl-CoA thioester hydrolase